MDGRRSVAAPGATPPGENRFGHPFGRNAIGSFRDLTSQFFESLCPARKLYRLVIVSKVHKRLSTTERGRLRDHLAIVSND